ncbi:MAG: hypothetical protein GC159_13320 [Phycisphaera sp.]|nr:hypothetical protein [Phycisphaera sp.]
MYLLPEMFSFFPQHHGPTRRRAIALVVAACAAALTATAWRCVPSALGAGKTEPPTLLAAAHDSIGNGVSASHLWITLRKPDGAFLLLHRTNETPDDVIYRALQAQGNPIAMAAYGSDLYVVFNDNTVQVIRPYATPMMGPSPVEFTQLRPLPKQAELIDIIADRTGPIVLLRMTGGDASGDAADKTTDKASGESTPDAPAERADGLRLLSLGGYEWTPIALPPELPPDLPTDTRRLRLVRFSDNLGATEFGVLDAPKGADAALYRYRDAKWSAAETYPMKLGDDAAAVAGANSLFVVQRDRTDRARLTVSVLRSGRVTPLRSIASLEPADAWRAVWHEGKLTTIIARVSGDVDWVRQDAQDTGAEAATPVKLGVDQPAPIEYSPVMLVVIICVVLGTFILLAGAKRAPDAVTPALPRHTELAGPHRAFAFAVDVAVPMLLSMYLFDIRNPLDVFERWVVNPTEWEDVYPGLTAIGVLIVHTTIGELLTGTSIGKAIFRCRVVDYAGKRPRVWQVLIRNLFKALELIPPFILLVMPLLSENQQRLGDMLGRTVVVRRLPGEADDDEADDASGDPSDKPDTDTSGDRSRGDRERW